MKPEFAVLRRVRLLTAVIGLVSIFSGCLFPFKEQEPGTREAVKSLFAVYMAGSNNLESEGLADIEEMKTAVASADDNGVIVILYDRIESASDGYSDWDDTRLFELRKTGGKAVLKELSSNELGISTEYIDEDLDMGDWRTLARFFLFLRNRYQAERLYIDIWNHGGGWAPYAAHGSSRAIAWDDESRNAVSLTGLSDALEIGGVSCEILMTDACSMALIETAAALLGHAETAIFSQRLVPGTGFPYDRIVPIIFDQTGVEEKCSRIVSAYREAYPGGNVTLSAVRIDRNGGLRSTIRELAAALDGLDAAAVRERRAGAEVFVSTAVDIPILIGDGPAADRVLSPAVITRFPEVLSGLSIYFPEYFSYCPLSPWYTTEHVSFLSLCPYRSFLESYNQSGTGNLDTFEPNNERAAASTIPDGGVVFSYLWCPEDRDWFVFNPEALRTVTIRLVCPEYADYDLKVFWRADGREKSRSSTSLSGIEEIIIDKYERDASSGILVYVYSPYNNYSQTERYLLQIR